MEFRDVEIMGAPEGVPEIERLIPRIPSKEENVNVKKHLEELVKDFQKSSEDFRKLNEDDKSKVRKDFLERIDNVLNSARFVHETWERDRNKLKSIREYVESL